jgi:hypothetical protein
LAAIVSLASLVRPGLALGQTSGAQPSEASSGSRSAAPVPASPNPGRPSASGQRAALGTILLVRTEGDEPIVLLIRAELRASAWLVVEMGPDPRLAQTRLRDLSASQSAAAAIRVHPEQREIELWVAAARGSTEGTLETLSPEGARSDDRVLALRVTETLRARGLKLDRATEATPPPEPEPPPQPPQPPTAKARPSATAQSASDDGHSSSSQEEREIEVAPATARLALEVAPATAFSAGGLKPSLDGWLALRLRLTRVWSIAGFGLAPFWSERLVGPEGSARISLSMFGGVTDLHLIRSRWELRVGAGVGGVLSLMKGAAATGFIGADQTVTAVAPFGHVALTYALGTGGFRLCLGTVVGATFPELSVRFAMREAARWGRPFALGSLGIEIPLLTDDSLR